MNNKCNSLAAAGCLVFCSTASALDTSELFLCAVAQVNECLDGAGCETVLPEEVNAPTFLWVDISRKQIRTNLNTSGSKIANQIEIDGRHIFQGAEDGNPNVEDGAGWTLSVEDTTGRFAASIVVQQATLNLFGACTELP